MASFFVILTSCHFLEINAQMTNAQMTIFLYARKRGHARGPLNYIYLVFDITKFDKLYTETEK